MRPWIVIVVLAVLLPACGSGATESPSEAEPQDTPPAGGAATEPTGETATAPAADTASSDAAAGPTETTTVLMGIQEGAGSNLPAVIAQQQGIFAEHGLEVEFVPLAGSALLSSLVSGSVAFFSQAPQMAVTAATQGAALQFFCGNVPGNWTSVMAPVDNDLPSIADGATWQEVMQALEGRRLGLAALGATQEFWTRALADAAGADADAMILTPIGVGPPAIAALDGDQVDAFLGYPFLEQQLVARGDVELLFSFSEEGPLAGEMITGFLATADWVQANPETASAVCESLGTAMAFFQDEANRDVVDQVLSEEFGIADQAVRDEVLDGGVLELFDPELYCEPLEQAISVFNEFGSGAAAEVGCGELFWQGAG